MLAKLQHFFNSKLVDTNQHPVDNNLLQLSAAALLIELSRADFQRDESEKSAISAALTKAFALDTDELKELMSLAEEQNREATSLHQFTQLINQHYADEEKYRLIEMLWQVAVADGEISKYEDHLIRKIADLIYVPHREFIRAKLAVLEND